MYLPRRALSPGSSRWAGGKVDVLISIDATAADKVAVSLNRSVADGYYTALTQMRDAYNLKDDISVSLSPGSRMCFWWRRSRGMPM